MTGLAFGLPVLERLTFLQLKNGPKHSARVLQH